jgi:hypothetical protein
MMKVGREITEVVRRLVRILCFGRQIAETILAVFTRFLILFEFLLSDNSVKRVEFKNLLKSPTV